MSDMRNLIILFICALILTSCSTTRIDVDRLEPDGRRLVISNPVRYTISGTEYEFRLKAYEYKNKIDWYLVLTSDYFMSDSMKILLKLANKKETVYYFPCTNVNVSKYTSLPEAVSFGKVGNVPLEFQTYTNYTNLSYHYVSAFNISFQQLEKIKKHSIRKIRISPSPDCEYLQRAFFNDELGSKIGSFYRKINRRLKRPLVISNKKNFYDDF